MEKAHRNSPPIASFQDLLEGNGERFQEDYSRRQRKHPTLGKKAPLLGWDRSSTVNRNKCLGITCSEWEEEHSLTSLRREPNFYGVARTLQQIHLKNFFASPGWAASCRHLRRSTLTDSWEEIRWRWRIFLHTTRTDPGLRKTIHPLKNPHSSQKQGRY